VGRDVELGEEGEDASFDVVAKGSDGGDVEAGGVVEDPLFIAFAGEDWACVAAAHGDDDVGGTHDLVGPGFGYSPEMSMPRSAMAWIAAGFTSFPGSEPPDQAIAASPA
jgi:hypothetical protein